MKKSRRTWKPARSLIAPLSPPQLNTQHFAEAHPVSVIVSMRFSLDAPKYEFFSLFRAQAQIDAVVPVVN